MGKQRVDWETDNTVGAYVTENARECMTVRGSKRDFVRPPKWKMKQLTALCIGVGITLVSRFEMSP